MGFTFEEFPDADYYRSDLRAVLKYVRSISDYLKTLDDVIEELREGLARLDAIEDNVKLLNDEFEDLHIKVTGLITDVRDIQIHLESLDFSIEELTHKINLIDIEVRAVYQYVDDKFAELQAQYQEDFNLLQLKINQIKVSLENEIGELRERVDSIDTSVYNSWMDRVVSPQELNDFSYNHLADECLTAEEYVSLGYTAADYAALDITSHDYQEFGKKKTKFNWLMSPLTGVRQTLYVVLDSIVNFLCGTMSASQYASLDLTADEYSSLDLSAEGYLKYNPFIGSGYVSVDPTGNGLTVEQYNHLKSN